MLDVYCIHLYRLEEGCDSIDYIMTHEKGQKGKTLTADFVQLTLLFLWTSLGLNQGPPDYESVALFGIEKLRFPMQPTELQVLCTSLLTS